MSDSFSYSDVIHLKRKIFRRMAQTCGGYTTLNELIVMNFLWVCEDSGRPCTVSFAADELGMEKSTVSRIFTSMLQRKLVVEHIDEADRRFRYFCPTEKYHKRLLDDVWDMMSWVNEERLGDRLRRDTVRSLDVSSIKKKLSFANSD